jgi:hypothetical protein
MPGTVRDPLRTMKLPIIIPAMRRSWRALLGWGIVAGVVLVIVISANLNRLKLAIAFATAERRPELLSDARLQAPASAVKFVRRFGRGARERDLVSWLGTSKFQLDRPNGHARRLVRSLPCNEDIEIDWTADVRGRLSSATAKVSEAGCL